MAIYIKHIAGKMPVNIQLSTLLTLLFCIILLAGCGGSGSPSSSSAGGVGGGGGSSKSATLTWDSPTTNMDGSCLTNLGGYKLYYGTTSRFDGSFTQYSYNTSIDKGNCVDKTPPEITGCGNTQVCTATLSGITTGKTYYFAATAYNSLSNESSFSNEESANF